MATPDPTPAAWAHIAIPDILTDAQTQQILRTVIYPAVDATSFTGFLYAGLMMTADGPKVLEFNVRLGDPETQPLMHRMASDFVPLLLAAAEGKLAGARIEWKREPSVCVVLASGGYPGAFETGKPITESGPPRPRAQPSSRREPGTAREASRHPADGCWE